MADIEADNLLDDATKIHVLSFKLADKKIQSIEGANKERLIAFFNYHIEKNIPVVMHNGILYDTPLAEKILGVDLSKLMVIDTLALSWYLNVERSVHGLDSFFGDYGIEKPKIEDWENLSYEDYRNRCVEDVKINVALWEDFKDRLYDMYTRAKQHIDSGLVDGKRVSADEVCYIDQYKNSSSVEDYIDRIITFLCHKMDITRLKEVTRFKADKQNIEKDLLELEGFIESAKTELESVMPQVAKYIKKTKPEECFKKNGEPSATGLNWQKALSNVGKFDNFGNELSKWVSETELKVLSKYAPPNINGSQQIKDFLFSKGWEPQTFKYDVDEEAKKAWADSGFKKHLKPKPRKIPQINKDGDNGKELCPSVIALAEVVPEIMAYAKYSVIKHRYGVLKGFLRDMSEDEYLKGRNGGFTNTLREQHRELVNLVAASKPYGKYIRGGLIAEEGKVLCGSDMSSLEDRVKHHFMIPFDPDYVATMMEEDFDPHILMALTSKLITEEEFKEFKKGNKTEKTKTARQVGKQAGYSCVYGAGAEKISLSTKVSLDLAKQLHEGYWKLNWSVKAIAESLCVITDKKGLKWLINPINGFCYNIRSDKDRFSTLCQGTGSFMFDMWVDTFLNKIHNKWGTKRLNFTAHDELVISPKDNQTIKNMIKSFLLGSVEEVNDRFKLRRKLGCDVQFGYRYSEIH